MRRVNDKNFAESAKKWIFRFIKFNIIGFSVFLIATAIFAMSFSTFGVWTWVVANGFGGVLQFSLITYLNRTKIGSIFDSCETRKQENYNSK
jgi:hypothetical protein